MSGNDFADFVERHYRVRPGRNSPYYDPLQEKFKYSNWPRGTFLSTAEGSKLATEGALAVTAGAPAEQDAEGDDPPPHGDAAKEPAEQEGKRFILMADPLEVIRSSYLREGSPRIPLLPFAIWMLRGHDFPEGSTAEDVVNELLQYVQLPEAEVEVLFDPDITAPELIGDDPLWAPGPWDPNDCEDLVTGHGAEVVMVDEDLVTAVHRHIRDTCLFDVDIEFVRAFLTALRTDRFVILAGKPGTGKTEFTRFFVAALEHVLGDNWDVALVEHEVHDETDEWEILGSRDLSGKYVPSEVMTRLNDFNDPDRAVRVLLLDEMNRAQVDVYAGRIISAVHRGTPIFLPGDTEDVEWVDNGAPWIPGPGVLLVAGINSYLSEPGRHPLSGPVKRRASVLPMPDPLANVGRGKKEFERLCRDVLVPQERRRIEGRGVSLLEASLVDRLNRPIDGRIVDMLWELATILVPHPQIPFSLGIVQDVLVFCLASEDPFAALDMALTAKVAPLIRGSQAILEGLLQAVPETMRGFRAELNHLAVVAEANGGRVEPIY